MPQEFQPYFYLSKTDIHKPNGGKMVGGLLMVGGLIVLLLKLFGIVKISWGALLILMGFAAASLYLGKTVHKNKAPPDEHPMEMLHSR